MLQVIYNNNIALLIGHYNPLSVILRSCLLRDMPFRQQACTISPSYLLVNTFDKTEKREILKRETKWDSVLRVFLSRLHTCLVTLLFILKEQISTSTTTYCYFYSPELKSYTEQENIFRFSYLTNIQNFAAECSWVCTTSTSTYKKSIAYLTL